MKTVRKLHVKVKKAKGRKISSTRWLQRQLNDIYVSAAKTDGYRSRSAYKLLQLNEKFQFISNGMKVVDLGSTPGGWSQVAAKLTNATGSVKHELQGGVLAVDINPMDPIEGVDFHQFNAFDYQHNTIFNERFPNGVDGVLSDMASPATGHKKTDHIRIVALCELAYELANGILTEGGFFVAKVLEGGTDRQLLYQLQRSFSKIKTFKPDATRKDSSEKYLICLGYRSETTQSELKNQLIP